MYRQRSEQDFYTKTPDFIPQCQKLSNYLVRAKRYPIARTAINQKFDWSARCLVYLLACCKCKIQYIGQTVDQFRSR